MLICFLWAILLGVVEGVTEWLPVSSTGHLLLLQSIFGIRLCEGMSGELYAGFCEMFDIVIQLGAVAAVAVRFFSRLWPIRRPAGVRREVVRLWGLLIAASLPSAAVGLVLDKLLERLSGRDIDGWLYRPAVIAAALVVYGVLFIVVERRGRACADGRPEAKVGLGTALGMGVCQMLAIVPGTSRSGATMLGGRLMGLSRPAAAEFSFLMAVPAMAGAGLIKSVGFLRQVAECGETVPPVAWGILAAASLTAFLVSEVTIGFLTDFVKRHTLTPFGVYRLILGAAVAIYFRMV